MNFLQHFRHHVQALAYGNPLYRMMLDQKPGPDSLRVALADPWPGNAEAGQALMGRQDDLFEREGPENPAKSHYVLTHGWLKDLRAVGTEAAKRKARALIEDWLAHHDKWREDSWAHDVLGERISNWVCFYDFFAGSAFSDFSDRLIASMMRQWRHLMRTMPANLTGTESLLAIKGILMAGLSLTDGNEALGLGLELLRRQLFSEILADGGHISRNPLLQLQLLHSLIDIRAVLRAAGSDVPHELDTAIERMVPALKLFRHGDGGLALFNGAQEASPLEMEAALTLSGARGRVLRRLPQMGYERLTSGRSLLLIDAGAPPPPPHDRTAHAGLLSFEFSIGRERLIVNCGAGPDDDAEWRTAMAATAAHSTLTLKDTNACEVLPEGGIGQRPKHVTAQRYEQEGSYFVEASHSGYENRFHVIHHRSLCLAAEGDELHGRDVLSGPAGRDFAVRWHLHPSVQASLAQGGQAAILRLPSNSGWRLRVDNAAQGSELSLEPSVYGGGLSPRRSLQIRVSGRTREDPTVINWLLAKEKKG